MLVTDKNYLMIESYVKQSTSEIDIAADEQFLWKIAGDLEDTSCLFKIARVFSCFLKWICLEGWYLNQVKGVVVEYKEAFKDFFFKTFRDNIFASGPKNNQKRLGNTPLIDRLMSESRVTSKTYNEATRILNLTKPDEEKS